MRRRSRSRWFWPAIATAMLCRSTELVVEDGASSKGGCGSTAPYSLLSDFCACSTSEV